MTSRERVLKAINHEIPDRVPVDIGGTKETSVHIDEYCDIIRFLGLDQGPPKVYEQFMMLARCDEMLMRYFGSDVIQVENITEDWGLHNDNWKLWTTNAGNRVLMPGDFEPIKKDGMIRLYDKAGCGIAYMSENSHYFERDCSTSLSDEFVFADPQQWKNSIGVYTDEELRIMEKRAKFFDEYTDYSVHGGFLRGGLMSNGIMAGHTVTDWMCLLVQEPEYVTEILSVTVEKVIENLVGYLQAVGKYVDTILVSGADFGSQRCELFNPRIWGELYTSQYKKINDYIHENSSAKTMFHSCGSIYNIIPHMIKAGVDILNPVQTTAANMDAKRLKAEFGDKIVFWGGGTDTQKVLPFGTPEEVAEDVRERFEAFMPGGGFVFATTHNMQYGIPVKNVDSMINAIRKYGGY